MSTAGWMERNQTRKGCSSGKSLGIDGPKLALVPSGLTPGDRAGGFERHDDVVAQGEDGVQVLGRSVPTVG